MSDSDHNTSRFTMLWAGAQPVVSGYVATLVRDPAAVYKLIEIISRIAAEKLDAYDGSTSFDAWVLAIARVKVIQYNHEVARRGQLVFNDVIVNQLSEEYTTLSQGYDDRLAALRVCMQKLPEESRVLLSRRYHHEQQVAAIAEQIGQPAEKVSKTLYTIRRGLERCISRRIRSRRVAR